MITINCDNTGEKGFIERMLVAAAKTTVSVHEDREVVGASHISLSCAEDQTTKEYNINLTKQVPHHYEINEALR